MNAKYYPTLKFLRQCAVMKRRFTLPFTLIKSKFWLSESYYPELPNHKSRFRIFCELMGHIWKYGSIEWFYFAYGFDIKNFRKQNEYLDEGNFMWTCNMQNMILADWDYTCLLRDKKIFADMLTCWGYITPHVIYDIKMNAELGTIVDNMLTNGGGYFCKPFDGQCGEGVFKLIVNKDSCQIDDVRLDKESAKMDVMSRMKGKHYLVQTLVIQHPLLSQMHPSSINTFRLTTFYDKKGHRVIPFAGFFRVGVNDAIMDNWAAGGIAIGVDLKTGKLTKYGLYKHGYGAKTDRHPNSGVIFDNFVIPYYEEAIKQALELHERLKDIPIIGWDIAISPEGPIFIEGNDNIEIAPIQCGNGYGLKKEFEKYFR